MSNLWVGRLVIGDANLWAVSQGEQGLIGTPTARRAIGASASLFTDRPEVASVSVVRPGSLPGGSRSDPASPVQAAAAVLPLCFLNDSIVDLIGMDRTLDGRQVSVATFEEWISRATRKGLVHVWIADDEGEGPPPSDSHSRRPLSIAFDAAWLLGGESGAQVFAFELVRALAARDDIRAITMLSDAGAMPASLADLPKVTARSWRSAIAGGQRFDILHRPYQPGLDVDYSRYHRVADAVAITVLDFIAYDNPAYHEAGSAWRDYQRLFDEQVCLADRVFAISEYVGARLQRQFAHQLSAPVRAIHPGTDHLRRSRPDNEARVVAQLENGPYLLILGNDFEHKNRDFAVKVFAELCDRGYAGRLALVGFHLDLGSTYGSELDHAGRHRDRVVRLGAVPSDQKRWLLAHADAVLYPTSSEGFGFVPFEAAAFGRPTAFVRFGPLRETLPGVRACAAWSVQAFADHVWALLEHPSEQLEQIAAAAAGLTWSACADQTVAAYDDMRTDTSPWFTRRVSPTVPTRWQAALAHPQLRRVQRVARRVAGLPPR